MKFPVAITKTVGRSVLQFKKNSPGLMFGAGVTTAVTATVFACKATLNLEETLLKYEERRRDTDHALKVSSEHYTVKDHANENRMIRLAMTRDIAKLYALPVGLGVVAIGLLTGAHITLNKRNAAVIAAYNLLDQGFKEYRGRVREEFGDEKDRELFFGVKEKEIVEEGEHGHEVKRIKRASGIHSVYARPFTKDGNECWSDSALNNRYFLQSQQNYLNDLLQSRGHVFLNDAYDLLKMERSIAGSQVGWVKGHGDDFIDFGLFPSNDPVVRDFMNLEHNDGIMIDFNVDGVVYDLLDRKY